MQQDPFAVIEQDVPQFSERQAIDIARTHYGLDVSVEALVSERDQNFRLRTTEGRDYVLKIGNAAEEAMATHFQIEALLYVAAAIERDAMPIRAPEILLAKNGDTHLVLRSAQGRHIARVVSFLPGRPLAMRTASPALASNMGRYLAWLGRALAGFSHPGSRHSLLWDLQQALQIRRLTGFIPEADVATAVSQALDDFEHIALPSLASLRAQVIHNDLNPDNVLTDPRDPDRVAGIIDFGDMVHAPLIIDVAIGASYQRSVDGDPLKLIVEFLSGYQAVTALTEAELDILHVLIKARLSTSIAILDWRASLRGSDDPYLEMTMQGEASAKRFLRRLQEIPESIARQRLAESSAFAQSRSR